MTEVEAKSRARLVLRLPKVPSSWETPWPHLASLAVTILQALLPSGAILHIARHQQGPPPWSQSVVRMLIGEKCQLSILCGKSDPIYGP